VPVTVPTDMDVEIGMRTPSVPVLYPGPSLVIRADVTGVGIPSGPVVTDVELLPVIKVVDSESVPVLFVVPTGSVAPGGAQKPASVMDVGTPVPVVTLDPSMTLVPVETEAVFEILMGTPFTSVENTEIVDSPASPVMEDDMVDTTGVGKPSDPVEVIVTI
jgi:hypothetical protein